MKANIPVQKGEVIEINITGLGSSGEGVGKYQGFTVFVPGALPNETIKAKVVLVKKNYASARIEEILKIFCDTEDYGTILRAKGMVEGTDGTWIYFDMVPGEYELREGQPDYTGRLCVIGANIKEDALKELFGV